jgi:hypothetical protein
MRKTLQRLFVLVLAVSESYNATAVSPAPFTYSADSDSRRLQTDGGNHRHGSVSNAERETGRTTPKKEGASVEGLNVSEYRVPVFIKLHKARCEDCWRWWDHATPSISPYWAMPAYL